MTHPEQSLCEYSYGRSYGPLAEVLHQVEAVDASLLNRHSCWQDVVDAIETAKAQDNAKADKSLMRARLRKSGPQIALLESLAGMIPDQDGLSILRGGLTTLLKMVALRLEARAMILEAFETTPQTFIEAVQAGMRFPDAVDLLQAVKQLYDTLVEKVPTLIEVLLHSHPNKNRVTRFLRHLPGRDVEVVQSCIDEVSRAADRVSRCSKAALERAVGEIRHEQRSIGADVKAIESGIGGIQDAIDDGVRRLESRWRGIDAVNLKHVETVAENSRKMLEAADQLLKLGWHQQQYPALPWLQAPIINTTAVGGDTTNSDRADDVPVTLSPGISIASEPRRPVTGARRAGGGCGRSLANVKRHSSDQRAAAGGWDSRLMSMERFRDWLGAPWWESDLVLVEGHCGIVAADNVSPLSAICASLVRVLTSQERDSTRRLPAAMVLHHFCGQHLTHRDPLKGPAGLIRSLIHQLLVQRSDVEAGTLSLDFVDDQLVDGVAEHDIPSLCHLFGELVSRLHPSRPVFCIIDEISEIETALDGWQDDTCLIVDALLSLVEDVHRAGPTLRVLLATSTRSAELADSVVPSDRRVVLLAGNSPGWRSYQSLIERDLEDLLMAGETDAKPAGEGGLYSVS